MFFINTAKKHCGVYDYGRYVYDSIKSLGFIYTEDLNNLPKNDLYIFNWHPGTNLNCINKELLDNLGGKSIGFLHDPVHNPPFFDIKCRLDPTFEDCHPFYSLPRIIKLYKFPDINRDRMIISSWGYGIPHKQFQNIIGLIDFQMEDALVRLHLPFSGWDKTHEHVKEFAIYCKKIIRYNELICTHNYMDDDNFIKWANESTINVFGCEDYVKGCGISSCIDTALMAQRPIAVVNHMLYKHVYSDDINLSYHNLKRIVKNSSILDKYRKAWTEESFRNKIKCLVEKIQQ